MYKTGLKMRKKDREVTDEEKIKQIIKDCHCCRVGLYDGNSPYIVPLNFGYEEKEKLSPYHQHSPLGLIRTLNGLTQELVLTLTLGVCNSFKLNIRTETA